jgi:glycine hydroxymethyltransferase
MTTAGSLLQHYLDSALPGLDPGKLSLENLAVAASLDLVARADPPTAQAVLDELLDQRASLKLIASENYASPAVLAAMGNWLSDKYAEGVPGHRHYAGCEHVDAIEAHAAKQARTLFGAEHAYVQPHSGIDANLVAFWAVLSERVETPALERAGVAHVNDLSERDWEALRQQLGNQVLLGMDLGAGGHLTHGFRPNISGKLFRHRSYGVDPRTGLIDYDAVRDIARRERPLILLAGYSAYPRSIDFAAFREIADEVGAVLMVDMAHFAGLVAGKVLTGEADPVAHADIVTTTTHKTLRGPRGGLVLCRDPLAPYVDRGCPLVLGGPLPHVMAAKAVALAEASRPEFAAYARSVVANARALASSLVAHGLPVLTGGTDNHLVMVDLRSTALTGRIAEAALHEASITCNRNPIPDDPQGAWYTSGLRLGTAALTTRGMQPGEMDEIAGLIAAIVDGTEPATIASGPNAGHPSRARYAVEESVLAHTQQAVAALLARFPLYPGLLEEGPLRPSP